jgi:hypothetical protein
MSGLSRKLWRYGVPAALFLTGIALVITERTVGIGWGVMLVSLAWAAHCVKNRRYALTHRRKTRGRPRVM